MSLSQQYEYVKSLKEKYKTIFKNHTDVTIENQLTDVEFTELQNTTEEENQKKLYNNVNIKYMHFLENIPNKEFAMQLLEMAERNN